MTDGESVREILTNTGEAIDRLEATADEGHRRLLAKLDELANDD